MFRRQHSRFRREDYLVKVLIWSLVIKGVIIGELDHSFIMFLAGV